MSRFIETIRILNGKRYNLAGHTERMNRTRREVLGCRDVINLDRLLEVTGSAKHGLFKCRVTYGEEIENIEFERYQMRQVRSLKLVDAGSLEYQYKSADRSEIDRLFARKGTCDEILMVRDGYLTDASYANCVLLRGNTWYTPSKPLLRGTMRKQLIDAGRIRPGTIRVDDLFRYDACVLINAMIGFQPEQAIPINQIES